MQVIELKKEIYGPTDPALAASINNLAVHCYCTLLFDRYLTVSLGFTIQHG